MKRMLLLGGVRPSCEIVLEAKRLGFETHVTDYLENSPAKKIADYSHMVSTTDVEAVVSLCNEYCIDGVFTGYVDSLLPYCQRICEKMNFPFWGDAENIDMCINKEKFKDACEESGVPVVPWKLANKENYLDVLKTIALPAVFKPVDNSGSRGVYKCYKKEDMVSLAEKALAMSKRGEILVEKLMDPNNEFSLYYMIRDGQATLCAMGDRYVRIIDKQIAPVGQGMLYPSVHLQEWLSKGDKVVKRFLKNNRMKNGFVFLQGFYDDGFYIHEIGYRLNGGFTYKIVEYFSNYNQLDELIQYSLTGNMNKKNELLDSPYFNGYGMIVTITLNSGTIGCVHGLSEVEAHPNVLHCYQLHDVGDELSSHGTTAQDFAFILCASANEEEMKSTISFIRDHLKVLDKNGVNMMNGIIDPDRINFRENKNEWKN